MGARILRESHRDRARRVSERGPVEMMILVILWMSTIVVALVLWLSYFV